jgi:hypothetical protein
MAASSDNKIKAIALDGSAVFDLRPVVVLTEHIFPGCANAHEPSRCWRLRSYRPVFNNVAEAGISAVEGWKDCSAMDAAESPA